MEHKTSKLIIGNIDSYDDGVVSGWAANPEENNERCEIVATVDGKIVSRTIASLYRGDLAAAGYGDGKHGFEIRLSNNIAESGDEIKLYDRKTMNELPGSPIVYRKMSDVRFVFDVSDLFFYLSHHDNPTGIQRVVISLISGLIEKENISTSQLGFIYFDEQNLSFRSLNTAKFVGLLDDLKLPKERRAFPIATGRRDDLARSLNVSESPFRADQHTSVIMLGAAWVFSEYFVAVKALQEDGARFCCLIHDLIPIKMPTLCDKGTAEIFKFFIKRVAFYADVLMTVSEYTAKDLKEYLDTYRLPVPPITVIQNGDNINLAPVKSNYYKSRAVGQYVLFVSTIEGRKNHQLVFDAWRSLKEKYGSSLPKMIFVGRIGWRVEGLVEALYECNFLDGSISIMSEISDEELFHLYENCLFTVYPSLYEGWGLPVGESLSFGKVCVASDRTSIPEAARGCAILIDPTNLEEFTTKVERLISDRSHLRAAEELIAEKFQVIPWEVVADRLIAAVNLAFEGNRRFPITIAVANELSFRAMSYLGADVSHGDEVARHSKMFSSSRMLRSPLKIENYIYSELAMSGSGWYPREAWGRWSKINQGAQFDFNVESDKELFAYFILRLDACVLPAELAITNKYGARELIVADSTRKLIRVDLKAYTEEKNVKISFSILSRVKQIKEDNRALGVGFEAAVLLYRDDLHSRLDLLEMSH